MNYIKTIPLHKNTKKSWLWLVYEAINKLDKDYLYALQLGKIKGTNTIWQHVNYQNILRAERIRIRGNQRPIKNNKWWLDVRKGWRKRGIKYDLNKELFYKLN